jgi:DNA-binding MarR family transcriptional regulator
MGTKKIAMTSVDNELTEPIADNILRAIRRILRKTAEHSRHLAREGDLSVPQLLCLREVAKSKQKQAVTVAEVAKAVQLSIATASRILDRLESAELIRRERSSEDRRKVYLKLTASGRRKITRLPTPLQEQFLANLSILPAKEQEQLLSSLERIVEMMGASDMDASPMLTPVADVKPST